MADVRSLLKSERAARRVQHKYASYSTTGSLLCTVCHLQIKSESLWDGHLRSAGHIMREQKVQEPARNGNKVTNGKKRKASDDEEENDGTIRKKSKAANGLPDGFFDEDAEVVAPVTPSQMNEIQIPSRPATPSKPVKKAPEQPDVNEDEWAAFEADIATAEATAASHENGVIMAPAISAAELAVKDKEDENKKRRERQEAEQEGDKEDAVRKLEDEFEEMEGLEERVRKLREKREALRLKKSAAEIVPVSVPAETGVLEDADDDDDDEDEDDLAAFGRN